MEETEGREAAGWCVLLVVIWFLTWNSSAERKVSKSKNGKEKGSDELDQVAGNAEDEIGDRIAAARETELLYGPTSLLAVYGSMIVHICGSPHKFKVLMLG
jgi:hypothetical protein